MSQHVSGSGRDTERSPFDVVLDDAITAVIEREDVGGIVDYLKEDSSAKTAAIQEIIERCGENTTKAARLVVEIIELLSQR